ncbi:MAG: T9SS type A sorting domain-containing protein [Chloroflexota bacterium]
MDSTLYYGGTSDYRLTDMHDFSYPTVNLVIAVGDSGRIIRSTNKGDTWDIRTIGKQRYIWHIDMLNDQYGILQCVNSDEIASELWETTNGGIEWNMMNTPDLFSDSVIYHNIFIIKKGLFAASVMNFDFGNKRFLKVWGNWDSVIVTTPKDDKRFGHQICFLNENKGFLYGNAPPPDSLSHGINQNELLQLTRDGGKSWTTVKDTHTTGFGLIDIDFYNDKFGIMTTGNCKAYLTHNGGRTWRTINIGHPKLGSTNLLRSPRLTSFSSGYIIVNHEYVYKYRRDWSIEEDTVIAPEDTMPVKSYYTKNDSEFLINYPNPFSERTTIVYNLSQAGPMSLSIYDLQGNKIETLKEEFQYEGLHEADFENASLPPGCYYYQLRSGGQVLTRKMVVIK